MKNFRHFTKREHNAFLKWLDQDKAHQAYLCIRLGVATTNSVARWRAQDVPGPVDEILKIAADKNVRDEIENIRGYRREKLR